MRLPIPCVLLAALALAGCETSNFTPWPDNGTGGLAERRPSVDPKISLLNDRMLDMVERGARYYDAAAFQDAEMLMVKIRRESEGQFPEDTVIDIARLEKKLDAIDRNLPPRPTVVPQSN